MPERLSVKQFFDKYPDDHACLEEAFQQRYGDLGLCPKCLKDTKFYRVKGRKCYACPWCGFQLHPLADTIFHKSSTSLRNWFFAIYLFTVSKNGVSAKELQRQLGVTYKCAWRMAKQIRELFAPDDEPLKGVVEADETYVGGKGKAGNGEKGRSTKKKKPVLGIVERGGRVRATVIDDATSSTIMPLVCEAVEKGSHLMTDDYSVYTTVTLAGYKHSRIKHSKKQYVIGDTHTNTIEGFWGQLKRSINGTYHAVSPKYLQQYVNEFAYRYNHRFDSQNLFQTLLPTAVQRVL